MFMYLTAIITIVIAAGVNSATIPVNVKVKNLDELLYQRAVILNQEFSRTLGYYTPVNEKEKDVSEMLMNLKIKEIDDGFVDPNKFLPARNLIEVTDEIGKGTLFQLLKTMPKGGILHAHDSALGSSRNFIEYTYHPYCWVCFREDNDLTFTYSKEKPSLTKSCTTNWHLLSNIRQENATMIDEKLISHLQLDSHKNYKGLNDIWQDFEVVFDKRSDFLRFKPNFEKYVFSYLKEALEDNVQYLEIRSSLKPLFDLDQQYTRADTARLLIEIVEKFKKVNPNFIGLKVILSTYRGIGLTKLEDWIAESKTLKEEFPDFIVGYDLVGQEDLGRPLLDFAEHLANNTQDMNFYFHAGETNWFGTETDENIIDAILLGTKRIGHAYALNKHPLAAELVKKMDICIEVSPLSNQILHLVKDIRNHPAAYFIANNIPMVISSDDTTLWSASPLTHDFYVAFVGIASAHCDIRLLKQLIINSFKYSGMTEYEKTEALRKWDVSWKKWIDQTLKYKLDKL